jgi:hypothetical protein
MATGSRSDSSRLFTEADVAIGRAAVTVADSIVKGIYDHLYDRGAAVIWPGALTEIRVWADENGWEDPK